MTTQYSFSDTLPKDSGGAKSIALTNVAVSQLDYSLMAGIGPQVASSKIYAAIRIGTHVAGSKIENPAVGVALMAHYASNSSNIGIQQAVQLRGDDRGQLYVSGLSTFSCAIVATSRDTFTTTSGLIMQIIAAACGAIPGAQIRILNGAASLGHISFSQNSETITVGFINGACFSSLITEKVNTTQPVYVTAMYKTWGQGG